MPVLGSFALRLYSIWVINWRNQITFVEKKKKKYKSTNKFLVKLVKAKNVFYHL